MTHPIHAIIGDILTVILCLALIVPALFVLYWMARGAYKAAFLISDPEPPLFEKSILNTLPIGAPADGGAYTYDGHGFVRMDEEEAAEIRKLLKLKAKEGRRDPEGWDMLMPQPDPTHPEMMLEVLNDDDGDFGPDDLPDDDEVEKPDEMVKYA